MDEPNLLDDMDPNGGSEKKFEKKFDNIFDNKFERKFDNNYQNNRGRGGFDRGRGGFNRDRGDDRGFKKRNDDNEEPNLLDDGPSSFKPKRNFNNN